MEQLTTWADKHQKYSFIQGVSRKVAVSQNNTQTQEPRSEQEIDEVANQINKLIESSLDTFGKGTLLFLGGALSGTKNLIGSLETQVSFISTDRVVSKLIETLNAHGQEDTDFVWKKLELAVPSADLYNYFADSERINYVNPFLNRMLSIVNPDLYAKLNSTKSFSNKEAFSEEGLAIDEFIGVLEKTQSQVQLISKANGMDFLDSQTLIELTQYLLMLDSPLMNEIFTRMPYLLSDRDQDQDQDQAVVEMVKLGFSYDKLIALHVFEFYPKSWDELKAWVEVPYSWMVKALS